MSTERKSLAEQKAEVAALIAVARQAGMAVHADAFGRGEFLFSNVEVLKRLIDAARSQAPASQAPSSTQPLDIADLRDRLIATDEAIDDRDSRAAKAILREALRLLATPAAAPAPETQPDQGSSDPSISGEAREHSSVLQARKFRKKPVVIEAFQLTEKLAAAILSGAAKFPDDVEFCSASEKGGRVTSFHACIKTLEGRMDAQLGDWIIKGVKSEFYPCKPDIFAATYEPAAAPRQGSNGTGSGEEP